jgi:hypothetical protein
MREMLREVRTPDASGRSRRGGGRRFVFSFTLPGYAEVRLTLPDAAHLAVTSCSPRHT